MNAEEEEELNEQRRVAEHIRDLQRAVAEREAARLARPEPAAAGLLAHADPSKSAVASTPSGVMTTTFISPITFSQDWGGPFKVARRMIARREEARIRRLRAQKGASAHPLDGAVKAYELEKKRKDHPSMSWKGRAAEQQATSIYAKRQRRAERLLEEEEIPSLYDLCVNFLVKNFDCVESLGGVDSSIRTSVAHALVAAGKMNAQSFQAIAEVGIEALEIVDCSQIQEEQMALSLQEIIPAGLQYLVLDQAGRCFGPRVVEVILSTAKLANIKGLSFGGAHLLTDVDAAKIVESVSKTVTSLEFKACPLLGPYLCSSIMNSFSPEGTLLELVFEDVPITETQLKILGAHPTALKNLNSVSLKRLGGLNDDVVALFLHTAGERLETLDLTGNYNLTDASLSAIRRFSTRLQNLCLSGLRHCTAAGLEALFTFVPGMEEPPMLRTLDMSQCDHEAVTDQVVDLATQASTKKQVGVNDRTAILGGLVKLDIQGSTVVTDISMECVAATCTGTLEELNVSFCGHISDNGLGYLVDQVGSQLSKIHIWGCAQLTDEFLDGHRRAADPTLDVCGAWMKRTGDRSFF